MADSSQKIFLVLDIGTSDIKCGGVDAVGNIVARRKREFPMTQKQGAFEIDFDVFLDATAELLRECLADDLVRRAGVEALLVVSQAQTFAPVDADFRPLRPGMVWLDERADEEAAYLRERLPDFNAAAGFARPLVALYVSKLLWLKRHEPDVFAKARAFPLINEFLVYKLTGQFYSDSSSFGMGGVYDFRRNDLNPEILQILGLTKDFFPQVEKAAVKGALISEQIRREWRLSERFPVFMCGNDQGASACGAGLRRPGDVNINFGTALVIYTVTGSLTADLGDDQIAGKHPIGDSYFLLNFESDFGMQIRRLKERFFTRESYDQLFRTFLQHADVAAQPPADNADRDSLSPEHAHRLCAGVVKYYLARLQAHFERIQQAVAVKNISLSGGMAQSSVWLDILRDVLKQPFTVNNRVDAGLFGAIEIYLQNKTGRKSHDRFHL